MLRLLMVGATLAAAVVAIQLAMQPNHPSPTTQANASLPPQPQSQANVPAAPASARPLMVRGAPPPPPPMTARPVSREAAPARQIPSRLTAGSLIGLSILGANDETVGTIEDLVFDRRGRLQRVVVEVGRFLGVEQRKVALAWDQLRVDRSRDVVALALTRDELAALARHPGDTAPAGPPEPEHQPPAVATVPAVAR